MNETLTEMTGSADLIPAGFKLHREEFERLRQMIYDLSGIKLNDGKQQMVQSRLTKRLRTLNLRDFAEYIEYLAGHPAELTDMLNRITTNKTHFFREPKHFRMLKDLVLPEVTGQGNGTKCIQGWCAASSTGEEPYTIASVAYRFLESRPGWSMRLLASDLDTNVLDTARRGIYPMALFGQLPRKLAQACTVQNPGCTPGTFGFIEEIRRMISFRQINLMHTRYPIQSQLDFIFCRNVFIYFSKEDRDSVVDRFIALLKPGGYLFLGHSEVLDPERFRDSLRFIGNTSYQKLA